MKKSSSPEHEPQGNTVKHLSYHEAWERINQAQEHGFYLEAVTIEESIITDRLISHFVKRGVLEKPDALKKSFNNLIQLWCKHHPPTHTPGESAYLPTEVDEWRKQRNLIVHGMVKSHPGEAPDDIMDFLTTAKAAAEQGASLARAVCNWHKKVHAQRLPHRSSQWQIERNGSKTRNE